MLIDLLKELVLELLRKLFLEELCQRVKEKLGERARRRRLRPKQSLFRQFHIHHRDRLLHKLTTGANKKL